MFVFAYVPPLVVRFSVPILHLAVRVSLGWDADRMETRRERLKGEEECIDASYNIYSEKLVTEYVIDVSIHLERFKAMSTRSKI
jgi:hypothetical protein